MARYVQILALPLLLIGCNAPAPSPTASHTPLASTGTPTPTHAPSDQEATVTAYAVNATALPLTSTAVIAGIDTIEDYPLPWPMPPITDAQLESARACDVNQEYVKHYQSIPLDQMPGVAPPQSECEWAALAFAYAYRMSQLPPDTPRPDSARPIFLKAISQNPAFLFSNGIFTGYFRESQLVESPPAASPLSSIHIMDHSEGAGGTGTLDITLSNVSSNAPTVFGSYTVILVTMNALGTPSITRSEHPVTGPVDADLAQALAASLTDFVPVDAFPEPRGCAGGFSTWTLQFRYADGSTRDLTGYTIWQMTVDEQNYLQYGVSIPTALNAVLQSLKVPFLAVAGDPTCLPAASLNQVFPKR